MLRELSRRALWAYMNCVPLYTARSLTKRRDILAAFDGIRNLLWRRRCRHPSSSVYPALISTWLCSGSRRAHSSAECRKRTRKELSTVVCSSLAGPGAAGQATHPDSPMANKSEYTASMVDGCVLTVQEWLMKHTWIHWYIRDGHGNPSPLWHREK